MASFTLSEFVQASPAKTFAVFSDVENAARTITDIVRAEKLTPGPVRCGTKFRETRVVFKREAVETFEVTAFEPDAAFELTAVNCGVEYRTRFRFAPENGGTRVEVTFRSTALGFWTKVLSPLGSLMSGMIKKCLAKDMADLRVAAEGKQQTA